MSRALVILGLLLSAAAPIASGSYDGHRGCPLGYRSNVQWNVLPKLQTMAPEANATFFVVAASPGMAALSKESESQGDAVQILSLAGGPSSHARAYTQDERLAAQRATVQLDTPLANTMYLNLSKPVIGTFYYTTFKQVSDVHPATANSFRHNVRIEFFVGDDRIGGEDLQPSADTRIGVWTEYVFCFRPEVSALPKNEKISLRVTQLGEFGDGWVGTGASVRSYVNFYFFEQDPLAGALYVEDGELFHSGNIGTSSNPSDPSTASVAPLVALFIGRRRAAPLVAALLLLAGCTGSGVLEGGEGPEPTAPTVIQETGTERDPILGAEGLGRIRGVIRDGDQAEKPIRGAEVSLIATSYFTHTDASGAYVFDRVPLNTYLMEVKAEGFGPVRLNATTASGTITWLNVTLFRGVTVPGNDRPHPHDGWGPDVEKILYQDDVAGQWQERFVGDAVQSTAINALDLLLSNDQTWTCFTRWCERRIPIEDSDKPPVVLPGTRSATVTLTWPTSEMGAPDDIGLRVVTTSNRSAQQYFVPRGPGEPFTISTFPNEADPGHVNQTEWEFYLYVTRRAQSDYKTAAPLLYKSGPIAVDIRIQKGVVPFEPRHPDLWNGTNRQIAIWEQGLAPGPVCPDMPSSVVAWAPSPPALIPPGTLRIEGWLHWTAGSLPAPQVLTDPPWGLRFKPGNVLDAAWQEGLKAPTATPNPAGFNVTFTYTLAPGEADGFYRKESNWVFYLDDGEPPQYETPAGSFTRHDCSPLFTLTVFAVRDPDWKDT